MYIPSLQWTQVLLQETFIKYSSIYTKVYVVVSTMIVYKKLENYKFVLIGPLSTGLKMSNKK